MTKMFAGARLRRLREERGLTQRAVATRLHLSPSYVNQLENDQRPLTVPVLLSITSAFDLAPDHFAPDDEARLVADLQVVMLEGTGEATPSAAVLRETVIRTPEVARTTVALHRRLQAALDELDALRAQVSQPSGTSGAEPMPFEEVRDFFYDHQNYIDQIDTAAEHLVATEGLTVGSMEDGLTRVLAERYGLVVRLDQDGRLAPGVKRHVDTRAATLTVARWLTQGQRAFQLATQIALSGYSDVLGQLCAADRNLSDLGASLARIGLANYFAGAVLLPYRQIHAAAAEMHYDVELLAGRFDVSFETVCHRLSTLQRPGLRGIPMILVRTDRAGNISKRQSATAFHFSRAGGGCPRWVVHDAFSRPDRIVTQVAAMPDGRRYLWMAKTVSERNGGFGAQQRDFVIGLGCDVSHASRTTYAAGLALDDPGAATPIGPGCKLCPRTDCSQRAFPYVAAGILVDENTSSSLPYVPMS